MKEPNKLYGGVIFVSKKDDVPKQEHWAIFEFTSIHIPGDERSRTHPGHGYPAESKPIVVYKAYLNREDLETEIKKLEAAEFGKTSYVAVKVGKPATTSIKVEVSE